MPINFDARDVPALIALGSKKWSTYPGTIGMYLAEMDFGIAPQIEAALIEQVRSGSLAYIPVDDAAVTKRATADYLGTFGPAPDPDNIVLTPDVLRGLDAVLDHALEPGAPVVVPTPAYMPFLTRPVQHGHPVIEVPSPRDDEGCWRLDFDGIRSALADGGLLILCNPWNPTGRSLTREELETLAEIARDTDARVFEDNIHAPITLTAPFIPFGPLSEDTRSRTCSAIAASKGWNTAGLKCAELVFHNERDRAAFDLFDDAAIVGVRATAVAFRDSQDWIEEVRGHLAESARLVEERVASWRGVTMAPVEATYIGFLDFSQAQNPELRDDPAGYLREHAKVSLTPGGTCGSDYQSFARLVFATPRPVLNEALDRIEAALDGVDSPALD